ncbi:hypothetical protein GNIT_2372 [Glaciecola nitratireducens FR1064]|uniref:Uncharacterized protein n=1 Tax=Glaciecola nitratireducens (strain JCM 12485 / KCTC 12276 / FR1064) TaxID=1085623 RepID=G4QLX9_GLANF|nr:hypothetical protein GNIT_2372 [Glaciecola nitratireducens FR1064]
MFDADTKKAQFLWANRAWSDPRQMAQHCALFIYNKGRHRA